MSSESEPTLPYPEMGGQEWTSGWAGSSTSQERALNDARTGKATERQQRVLGYLSACGTEGVTVAELRDIEPSWHHGQASAALSNLHKAGRITRLTERRDKCQVYVLPQYVNDRPEAPYRPNKRNRMLTDEALAQAWDEGRKAGPEATNPYRSNE